MIVFVLMGIKQNIIIFEQPNLIFSSFIPLIVFYFFSYIISMAVYRYRGGSEGRAMVWGTYLRYITLALGLTTSLIYQNSSYSVMAIIIILSYLIQIPSSFLLIKILNKNNL